GREIERDPGKHFRPTLRGDVMYGGKALRGFPAEINDDAIVWRFFDNSGAEKRTRKSIVEAQLNVKDLVLYPFNHGELYGLLEDAGFVDIKVYADLGYLENGTSMPDPDQVGDADFITY